MEQTNILHVITKSNVGGAQRYVHDIASHLSTSEEVEVSTAMGGDGELSQHLREKGIEVTRLHYAQREINLWKEAGLACELFRLFLKKDPDVIHLNSTKIGGLGAFVARIYNLMPGRHAKIIFTAHGWAFTEERFSWLATKIYLLLQALTVIFSHKTIAVSAYTKKEMVRPFPSLEPKITVIHNGIAPFELKDKKTARKELLARIESPEAAQILSEDRHWIGSVAELHSNKGIDMGVRALANPVFEDTVYIIIGKGEEREYLNRLIKDHDISDRVFCIGYVEHARKYLSAFDTYLLPSRKEGFPYVLLEAGVAKLPVIASDVGGVSEIIHPHETGMLVPSNRKGKIREALQGYINNPEIAAEHGNALYREVTESFSREKMITETLSLY